MSRYGNGDELREYIHVEDAARYSVQVLDKEFENSYVILTGHQPMRIKDVMIMIKEMLNDKIELEFLPVNDESCPYDPKTHYNITPYSFSPKIAKKIVGKYYLDLGQGILQVLHEVYDRYTPHEEMNGIIIEKGDEPE